MRTESKMLNGMKLNVTLTDDFKVIEETTDFAGQIARRFADVRARALEDAVRTQLIALGWAPPEEVERLRELARRYEELQK